MKRISLIAAIAALILTTCSGAHTAVSIMWMDFLQIGEIHYLGVHPPFAEDAGRVIQESDLGPEFARVRFKVDGNIQRSDYRPKDGDAAFLEPGTRLYRVKGYVPTFRLAAVRDAGIVIYEAAANPRAKKGAYLLDIDGRVRSIAVKRMYMGTTGGMTIEDPRQIDAVVAMILEAPVDQSGAPESTQPYTVVFDLQDGTTVTRQYFRETNELGHGIKLPPEFAAIIGELPQPQPAFGQLQ